MKSKNSNQSVRKFVAVRGSLMVRGSSLIETMIYIVLLAFILTGTVVMAQRLFASSEEGMKRVVAEEEANFLLRKIEWVLGDIASVNTPSAGSNGTTLSVTRNNFSSNPVKITYTSGTVFIQFSSGQKEALNSDAVSITEVKFEHVRATGGKPPAVKAYFVLNGTTYDTIKYIRK